MRRRLVASLGTIATALALVACGANGNDGANGETAGNEDRELGDDPFELRVGATTTTQAVTAYLAESEGFFEDAGLDVEISAIQAAASAIPLLLNQELHYTLLTTVPTVNAIANDIPIAMALGNDTYYAEEGVDDSGIVVSPDSNIENAADLDGVSVAVIALSSAPELAARVAIDNQGGDSSTITFVEMGYGEMPGAVDQGTVDAAFITPPFFAQAVEGEDGLEPIIYPFAAGFPDSLAGTWVAGREFLEQEPEAAAAFEAAMREAIDFANDNPDAARDAIQEYSEIPEDVLATMPLNPYAADIQESDVSFMVDAMVQHGYIDETVETSEIIWND